MERLAGTGACHRPSSVSYSSHHLAVPVCRVNRVFLCRWSPQGACSRFSIHNGVAVPLSFKLFGPVASAFVAAVSDSSEAVIEEAAPETPVEESSALLVTTSFVLEKKCEFGERFMVAGDHELLGAWDVQSAVPMTWSEGHVWSCQVDLPAGKQYEYKFVLTRKNDEPHWQPGPNRSFVTIDSSTPLIISESWGTLENQTEVDEAKSEPSEPVAAAAGLELTETSTTESGSLEDKQAKAFEVSSDPVPAEPEVTDTTSAHVIDQDDDDVEGTESTPSVTDDTTSEAELTAKQDSLSATKDVAAAETDDEITSLPATELTGNEAPSVPATKGSTSAEADEVSLPPEESTAVVEDAKGFKRFKFDTPEERTNTKSKNGQPASSEGTVLDEVKGST